jgi:hypothetical protein
VDMNYTKRNCHLLSVFIPNRFRQLKDIIPYCKGYDDDDAVKML